jgi:hypothetical protein
VSIRRFLIIAVCALAVLMPCAANAVQNTVDFSTVFTNLGGGDYQYAFTFTNNGPNNDAIFKIQLDVPKSWQTIDLTMPAGWDAKGPNFDFQTSNGSLSASKGTDRIWGNPGAPFGPGATSETFTWKFKNTGSTTPTATFFDLADPKVHVQGIGSNWKNSGDSYLACVNHPKPAPTPEPSSLLALACGLTGLCGVVLKRRK